MKGYRLTPEGKALTEKLRNSGIEALNELADYVGRSSAERARAVRRITGESEVDFAYKMGADYYRNGPDGTNCHFEIFEKREQCEAWERGRDDAKKRGA